MRLILSDGVLFVYIWNDEKIKKKKEKRKRWKQKSKKTEIDLKRRIEKSY